ncbi:MAG: FG-GAP repeat protein [Planctomycetes bacterium]|nr:FG-GAP repeat protein [Planctomycetota bacterium]
MLTLIALLFVAPASQIVGGEWSTQYRFDGEGLGDQLGYKVAGVGDVNGDGFDDVLASAPWADPNSLDLAGSVFVYSGADGTLLHQWDGPTSSRWLGTAAAGAGDVNGDGFDDIIIGDGIIQGGNGSAYVYSGPDGALIYQFDGAAFPDAFGASVAGAGDVNADGYADLIIAASSADPGGRVNAGSVYVYSGADAALLHQWDGATTGDYFGSYVASAGDVNADGFDDLAVGARWIDSNGHADAGSAFVYSGADGTLLHHWDGVAAGDGFGCSITGTNDLNGDGFGDLIVGAWSEDSGGATDSGSASVFSGLDGSILYQFQGEWTNDHMGYSVSRAGDWNNDGTEDLLVGADGANYRGAAYLYSGVDGSLIHKWSGEATYDGFGFSVAYAGDTNADGNADVLVGAVYADFGGISTSGSAYVLGFNPILKASTGSISAAIGVAVDLEIAFPATAADNEYVVVMSASGTGPIFYGIDIPMSWDSYLLDSAAGIYPFPNTTDLRGTLDSFGKASAGFGIPAGVIPGHLIGQSFWMAVVSFPAGQLPELSSVAVKFTIEP